MVVAFAGRRVDRPTTPAPRFPRENVPIVRERVREALAKHGATTIVSAAACGADLLALEAAGELGARRVVVLPWDRERFRAGSVVDRGDEWGPVYDGIVDDVTVKGDLHVLAHTDDSPATFFATNDAILDTAVELARADGRSDAVMAVVAWDGEVRGPDDVTAHFLAAARQRGLPVTQVRTL